jgi:competence protein ComEC
VVAVRDDFAARVARFGGDGALLLPGLVLGDTSHVPETLDRAMKLTSLAHLTAVSGANCAVIVATLYGLSALAGFGIWVRTCVAALGLGAFVILVGAEPSVIRAAIMACLALLALAVGRPAGGLTVLCATVILALAFAPALAHSVGFALSVSATTGLLVLAMPLTEILERWLPRRFALVLAVPLAAQIAVQPLLLIFSSSIPTYGIPANALADPLAPLATIAGLVALVTISWPWVSLTFLGVAWLASGAIAGIARVTAALPWATIPWPSGSLGIALATLCTLLAAGAILTRRIAVAVIAAILVAGILSTTIGGGAVAWVRAPRDWSVAQCDVGQGDALVLRDGDAVALIDTGRDEHALRSCLDRLNIQQIDLLVLTHFDIDHVGAYNVVVGRVGTVLHGPTDGIADELTIRRLGEGGANVVDARRGLTGTFGRWDWRVLWPTKSITVEPGNPASVVVSFRSTTGARLSILGLGDLAEQQQDAMLGLGGITPVDVVKVSHHGSLDQSPALYVRLRAGLGLIGVGAGNEYGHPTDQTLAMLGAVGTLVVRSDRDGIALIGRDEDGALRVWRERAG